MDASLVPFFGDRRIQEIDEDLVLQFCMTSMERKVGNRTLSPKTVANHLGVLNAFFRWVGLRKHASHNPVPTARSHFKFQTPPDRGLRERVLDEGDFQRFYEFAKEHRPEVIPPCIIGVFLGARRGEVGGLLWDDYITHDLMGRPLKEPLLRICKQVLHDRKGVYHEDSTKTSRERMVPISQTVVAILEKWRLEAVSLFGYSIDKKASMFPIVATDPDNFSKNVFRRICEKAGLPKSKRSFHGLRHTFAAWLRFKDTSPRQLQLLLGHSTPEMSERYGRVFNAPIEALTNKLDGILALEGAPAPEFPPSGNVRSLQDARRRLAAVSGGWG